MPVKRKGSMLDASSYLGDSEESAGSDPEEDAEAQARAKEEEERRKQQKKQKEVDSLQKHGFKGTKDFRIKAKEEKKGIFSEPCALDLSGKLYRMDQPVTASSNSDLVLTDDNVGVGTIAKAMSATEGQKKSVWVLASEAEAARKQAELERLEQEERDRLKAARTETPEEEEARLIAEQVAEAERYQKAEAKRKAYIDKTRAASGKQLKDGYLTIAGRSSEGLQLLDDSPLEPGQADGATKLLPE